MPRYDFRCEECGTVLKNQFLRITHMPDEVPECCDQMMGYYITQPPLVHWVDPVIAPFRAIATADRPVITTAKQNREYMERNGLINANDCSPPPTKAEQNAEVDRMKESVDKITPTVAQETRMKDDGIMDPSFTPA